MVTTARRVKLQRRNYEQSIGPKCQKWTSPKQRHVESHVESLRLVQYCLVDSSLLITTLIFFIQEIPKGKYTFKTTKKASDALHALSQFISEIDDSDDAQADGEGQRKVCFFTYRVFCLCPVLFSVTSVISPPGSMHLGTPCQYSIAAFGKDSKYSASSENFSRWVT